MKNLEPPTSNGARTKISDQNKGKTNDKKYNAAEDSKNKFNRSKRGESFCKGFHIEVIGRNRKSRYTGP